jgi:hypothetical protein
MRPRLEDRTAKYMAEWVVQPVARGRSVREREREGEREATILRLVQRYPIIQQPMVVGAGLQRWTKVKEAQKLACLQVC